jgi:TolA-binding protein
MNLPWRIALYVVLTLGAVFFTQRFFAAVEQDRERVSARYAVAAEDATEAAPALTETNDLQSGNAEGGTGTVSQAGVTNTGETVESSGQAAPAAVEPPRSPKGLYGALALCSVLGLGLMVGREVSQFVGHHVQRELYGEASEPVGDPEYDEAERVWADGDHLEAVRLLREFLKQKPHKVHAAFRIAEIYEKDLGNPLAAALEYEVILGHRLERQRWGWAAIHLVNLYNRLGQTDKAEALLDRIVTECPGTEAAAKARQRLGLPEEGAVTEEPAPDEGSPGEGGFRLPPGFRPK